MKVTLATDRYPVVVPDWCAQCLQPVTVELESETDRQVWSRAGSLCGKCYEAQEAVR